ncbi:hypothetical protein B0H11DRAFT_1910322 [Mycena galericulata]|nr:hypothetical protein B0H11DRAFT_1910322 [Mycena galericulata]
MSAGEKEVNGSTRGMWDGLPWERLRVLAGFLGRGRPRRPRSGRGRAAAAARRTRGEGRAGFISMRWFRLERKMGRKKNGNAPGRSSSFKGEKLEWLESFEEEFRTLPRGKFYDDISKRFLARYGYDLPVDDNVPGDVEDWVPENRKAGLSGEELQAESDFQDEALQKLRTKLSNWYRHRFTGKKVHKGALRSILLRMQALGGNAMRPRRKTNLAYYSEKYYASKMKEGFDEVWAEAKKTLHPKLRVSMCQEYVQAKWEAETKEFKDEMITKVDEEHEAAMKKFRASHEWLEGTAESYHEALKNFDEVGIPLADALSERLGMHIAILAVGPVGSQKGEVRLRSVFSDTSGGATSKIWGQFDRAGFTAAEASLTRYGHLFEERPATDGGSVAKEQCRARAVAVKETAGDATTGTAAEATTAAGGTTTATSAEGETATTTPDLSGLLTIEQVNDDAPPPPPASPTPASAIASVPEIDAPSPGVDQFGWPEEQIEIYEYLSSKDWGPRWKELCEAVVAFEKSKWYIPERLAAIDRPDEIRQWMKEHRATGDYSIGEGFGQRLLKWWRTIGPKFRQKPRPEDLPAGECWPPRKKASWEEWCCVRKTGGNGMMILVRAFCWWGQAIHNAGEGEGLGGGQAALTNHAEWQYFLGDLLWSYGEMTDPLDPKVVEEEEEERRQSLREAGKTGGKKKPPTTKPPAKPPAKKSSTKSSTAKPAPKVTRKSKRKRAEDEEEPEDVPPAKSAKSQDNPGPEVARPKPRPIRSLRSTVAAAADDAGSEKAAAGGKTAGGEATDTGAGDAEMSSTDDRQAAEVFTPGNPPMAPQGAGSAAPVDNEEDPFFDPFRDDPMAGMTEEERRDYEEELADDPDADEDEEEEENDEENDE